MGREFRILESLENASYSKSPKPVLFCEDETVFGAPFFLMEYVDGANLRHLLESHQLNPREALALGKQLFYRQLETGMDAAYQLAGHTMACNMAHPVAQEGVQAFIDKRAPAWRT